MEESPSLLEFGLCDEVLFAAPLDAEKLNECSERFECCASGKRPSGCVKRASSSSNFCSKVLGAGGGMLILLVPGTDDGDFAMLCSVVRMELDAWMDDGICAL